MNKLEIFTITHKEDPILKNELYIPIQAGHGDNIYDFIKRDNYHDNIAEKNIYYSELSSTYWLWKNYNTQKYIGLAHYRRYLNIYPKKRIFNKPIENYSLDSFKKTKVYKTDIEIQEKKIIEILNKGYIILPRKVKFGNSIYKHYQESHYIEHLDLTLKIIEEFFPEYCKAANKIINSTEMYICNMFISTKQFWDDYHEWLFKILFELEKRIVIPKDVYQRRVFSFISERLLNIYIKKQKPKIKEFSIMFIEY